MNIIEDNNKLILDFMGIESFDNGVYPVECIHEGKGYHLETMKYHWSWDWLMPVVDKIESLNDKGVFYNVHILGGLTSYIISSDMVEIVNTDGGDSKIDNLYQTVIKFIKWYNNNKVDNSPHKLIHE